jgi:hypothetical protein
LSLVTVAVRNAAFVEQLVWELLQAATTSATKSG